MIDSFIFIHSFILSMILLKEEDKEFNLGRAVRPNVRRTYDHFCVSFNEENEIRLAPSKLQERSTIVSSLSSDSRRYVIVDFSNLHTNSNYSSEDIFLFHYKIVYYHLYTTEALSIFISSIKKYHDNNKINER